LQLSFKELNRLGFGFAALIFLGVVRVVQTLALVSKLVRRMFQNSQVDEGLFLVLLPSGQEIRFCTFATLGV
jgi:hypothetical protein